MWKEKSDDGSHETLKSRPRKVDTFEYVRLIDYYTEVQITDTKITCYAECSNHKDFQHATWQKERNCGVLGQLGNLYCLSGFISPYP